MKNLSLVSLLFVSLNSLAFASDKITTIKCSETEGPASWSLSVKEDQANKMFWVQVKYDLTDYICDDESNEAQVGLKCNPTGGQILITTQQVGFNSCSISSKNEVNCYNNSAPNKNQIVKLTKDSLNFNFEYYGENSDQIGNLLKSLTETKSNNFQKIKLSNCTKTEK